MQITKTSNVNRLRKFLENETPSSAIMLTKNITYHKFIMQFIIFAIKNNIRECVGFSFNSRSEEIILFLKK